MIGRPQLKILDAVVRPITLLVMYCLVRKKCATKMFCHDQPMLKNLTLRIRIGMTMSLDFSVSVFSAPSSRTVCNRFSPAMERTPLTALDLLIVVTTTQSLATNGVIASWK
jgi:hypothetical protein